MEKPIFKVVVVSFATSRLKSYLPEILLQVLEVALEVSSSAVAVNSCVRMAN